LAFVDDDVIVEPAWLRNLTAPLQDCRWAGCGGRILPMPGFVPPRWLPNSMYGVLCAQFDLGNDERELDQPPYGTNMAFQKRMFTKYGDFRVDLGPSPDSEIRAEDSEFCHRLTAGGGRLRYVPSAVVYHEVHENRVRKEFFLAWWFDYGRAQIRESGIRPDILGIPRPFLSIPNNIFRFLPARTVRWLTASNPQRRFTCKCMVWLTAGLIVETWRRSFGLSRQNKASEKTK